MDVREKLVELLNKANSACVGTDCFEGCKFYAENDCLYKLMADVMISHGVTVQEEAKLYWKPVKPGEWNLTCSACDSHLGCREDANFCPECGAKFVYPKAVAPHPPKGE